MLWRFGDLRHGSNLKRRQDNVKENGTLSSTLKLSDDDVNILRQISKKKYSLEDEIQVLKVAFNKILDLECYLDYNDFTRDTT